MLAGFGVQAFYQVWASTLAPWLLLSTDHDTTHCAVPMTASLVSSITKTLTRGPDDAQGEGALGSLAKFASTFSTELAEKIDPNY